MLHDAFIHILDSLSNTSNALLIESIKTGYALCFESDSTKQDSDDHYNKVAELKKIAPELFIAPERMTADEFKEKWPKIEARRKELLKTHPHLFR